MQYTNLIDIANHLSIQRLLSRYMADVPRYTTATLAGATILVEPSRHRTHVPVNAEARRYVVAHLDQQWSAVIRAVWRYGHLYSPAATHVAIEVINALDGAPDDVAAMRCNTWLRGLDPVMRLRDIVGPLAPEVMAEIDRICSPTMPADIRAEIEDAWRRAPPVRMSTADLSRMYGRGHEREELELRKLYAEVAKIEAEANEITAETGNYRRESRRSS